ncbi:MAG: glutathione S-transferase family protein [Alphaproteobacteria bacterium]
MVKLATSDIKTTEVLDWEGLHLFHFMGSSCSQKTRISFAAKGVEWESHHVDIAHFENFTEWFMGINPRGLMPTLVHDGDVHIESNDIIEYVDATFDGPKLFPSDPDEQAFVQASMKREDDLHLCVRALTFRYLLPVEMMKKPEDAVDVYEAEGAETVGGEVDGRKAIEVDFWRKMNANNGITDEQVIEAASEFLKAFGELEERLEEREWLLASGFSALDIAWWITVYRITKLGFPTERFPKLFAWYEKLLAREDFAREVAPPPEMIEVSRAHQAACVAEGKCMQQMMAAAGL